MFTKRNIMLFVAALIVAGAGYSAYHLFRFEPIKREADRTAPRIAQMKEKVTTEDLSRYFDGKPGAFVLFDQNRNEYTIYNEAMSQHRTAPCSTFKILNSLIGLETGVLQDENTLFKWDGKHNYIPEWDQDHTLTSAFKNSVVWYYQRVAEQVGEERMADYLHKVGYGNMDISGGLTQFWLDTSLRISPIEQVIFLRRFYDYDLPFSRRNIDLVKSIMVREKDDRRTLSAKGGTAGRHLSYFVGYVERDQNVYFFAALLEGSEGQIPNGIANDIAIKILTDKGIR